MVLLILEAKFGGHGALAIAGIVCLTFGTLTLVAAPVPEMGVSPWVAIGVSAAFGAITVFLVRLAVRARARKARIGADAMVGCRGDGDGSPCSAGTCAGGGRDLAGGGECAGSRRDRRCAWWATNRCCCEVEPEGPQSASRRISAGPCSFHAPYRHWSRIPAE